MSRGDIEKNTKKKYRQQLYCITYTKIKIQTLLEYAQKYQYKHRYDMHKHIDINAVIIQVQWQNKSFTGNIYNKIPQTRQTWGNNFVKCPNVSNITYIYSYCSQRPHFLSICS